MIRGMLNKLITSRVAYSQPRVTSTQVTSSSRIVAGRPVVPRRYVGRASHSLHVNMCKAIGVPCASSNEIKGLHKIVVTEMTFCHVTVSNMSRTYLYTRVPYYVTCKQVRALP